MKTSTTLFLAATIAGGSTLAQADDVFDAEWSACAAEVQAYYGNDTDVSLVDRRRNPRGTKLRVAARTDANNTKFATCWLPRYHEEGLADSENNHRQKADFLVIVSH